MILSQKRAGELRKLILCCMLSTRSNFNSRDTVLEAEAGGFRVPGQLGLHSDMSQKKMVKG
jgi:hypothetical protein